MPQLFGHLVTATVLPSSVVMWSCTSSASHFTHFNPVTPIPQTAQLYSAMSILLFYDGTSVEVVPVDCFWPSIGQPRRIAVRVHGATPYTLLSTGVDYQPGHFVIRGVAQQSGRVERLCGQGNSQRRRLSTPRSPWRLPPKTVRSRQASHQSALL